MSKKKVKVNKKEFEALTWKYFLQQKFVEIFLTVAIVALIVLGPYWLGHLIPDDILLNSFVCEMIEDTCLTQDRIYNYWLTGLLMILGLILVGVIFFGLVEATRGFLAWNWEKAEDRAKEFYGVDIDDGNFLEEEKK